MTDLNFKKLVLMSLTIINRLRFIISKDLRSCYDLATNSLRVRYEFATGKQGVSFTYPKCKHFEAAFDGLQRDALFDFLFALKFENLE